MTFEDIKKLGDGQAWQYGKLQMFTATETLVVGGFRKETKGKKISFVIDIFSTGDGEFEIVEADDLIEVLYDQSTYEHCSYVNDEIIRLVEISGYIPDLESWIGQFPLRDFSPLGEKSRNYELWKEGREMIGV